MSVSLLIKDSKDAKQRLVPVAVQAIFESRWVSGARELGLEWVELMSTGIDVTTENRNEVLEELRRLGEWMHQRGDSHERERLDRLVEELEALQFESGATAFVG